VACSLETSSSPDTGNLAVGEHAQEGRPALVLASGSPQRRALLERLGVAFTVRPSAVEELDRGDPGAISRENALRKARAASRPGANEAVLGCDTVVALGGMIYGKPPDERAARETLRTLSGVGHEVISGLALILPGEASEAGRPLGPADGARTEGDVRTAIARTAVVFRALSEDLLDWYLATGEWRGRAGGYAIQGAGAALVRSVEGDYENVVGLPLATLLDLYPELLN
jgi:septum formation protein